MYNACAVPLLNTRQCCSEKKIENWCAILMELRVTVQFIGEK